MGFLIYHFRYLQSVPESWPCFDCGPKEEMRAKVLRIALELAPYVPWRWHGMVISIATWLALLGSF